MQVAGADICEGAGHGLTHAGLLALPVVEQVFHGDALEAVLAAAEIAGDDREGHRFGEFCKVCFSGSDQGTEDHHVALIVQQFRRHRSEAAAVDKVHHEGFERVVPVVAEHDRLAAFLARHPVEDAAAQA